MSRAGIDENKISPNRKLTGWKMIGRHLGRSERTVQFWEEQRGLPVHRIPGGRGQTVFAYVNELDAWISGPSAINDDVLKPDAETVATLVAPRPSSPSRPPGILVLPLETRPGSDPCGAGDLLCQHLIVRLSAIQPVRVLSWTTSRTSTQALEPIEAIAARLNVRYVVESTIERIDAAVHVEVRIVDADVDQIMLVDRFVIDGHSPCAAYTALAEGVALHFALLHAGALVEPMCLHDMTPALFLDYLVAARHFFEDADGSTGRALGALEKIVAACPHFGAAQAMRGLALLQSSEGGRERSAVDEAMRILATCADDIAARVTSAFLGAAIVKHSAFGASSSAWAVRTALRWIPPSIARHGRLYERRSTLHRDHHVAGSSRLVVDRRGQDTRVRGHKLLDELLQDLVAVHHHHERRGDPHARAAGSGTPFHSTSAANEHAIFHNVHRDATER